MYYYCDASLRHTGSGESVGHEGFYRLTLRLSQNRSFVTLTRPRSFLQGWMRVDECQNRCHNQGSKRLCFLRVLTQKRARGCTLAMSGFPNTNKMKPYKSMR